MVKPEKFDHLHLIYHFTVPLINFYFFKKKQKSLNSGMYFETGHSQQDYFPITNSMQCLVI